MAQEAQNLLNYHHRAVSYATLVEHGSDPFAYQRAMSHQLNGISYRKAIDCDPKKPEQKIGEGYGPKSRV